jgi:hypothetical protein
MPTSSSELVAIERPKTNSRIFAHTRWDIIPVAAAALHCIYFFGMFYLFPRVPLWVMLILGFIYSVSISWNINGISHNFIHNPYFRSPLLNRLFSIMESMTVGFGQVFYECIHMQHHKGNADRPDDHGDTIDWISIYKHGHDGEAEHPLKYTRRSQDRFEGIKAKKSALGVLGSVRVGVFRDDFCDPRYSELALHLFPFAVLVFWPLPLLSERLLPSLRRQPRRADCMGR